MIKESTLELGQSSNKTPLTTINTQEDRLHRPLGRLRQNPHIVPNGNVMRTSLLQKKKDVGRNVSNKFEDSDVIKDISTRGILQ